MHEYLNTRYDAGKSMLLHGTVRFEESCGGEDMKAEKNCILKDLIEGRDNDEHDQNL